MKTLFNYLNLFLIATYLLSSCSNNETDDAFPSELTQGCYIVNFGNYGKGGASISKFDYYSGQVTNFYNEQQNGGKEMLSNIQYALPYHDSIFLIGNAPDQLITMNPLMVQKQNGLTDKLANPRFCVAYGDYLYISCLGTNPDWNKMPGSYVARYKIGQKTVEKPIALPGGPEGMIIANDKLFVALNYKDSIGVIDLKTEKVSYIATPAVSSYFLKDKLGNLYVTMVSTYNNSSNKTGLGYIDVKNAKLDTVYLHTGISNSYGSIMTANNDFTKIYVVSSSYDASWNLTGAVEEFSTATRKFSQNPLINNIPGISAVLVNAYDNNLYVLSATSATGAGKLQVFSKTGTPLNSYSLGAFPVSGFFQE